MVNIHQSAIISDKAKIGNNVEIGPYCVIGDNVEIGDNCKLHSHIVLDGYTIIGQNNEIFPFTTIGMAPQDLKYSGEKSQVIIGDNNKIREYVTIHPGTKEDNMKTIIGNNCLLMVSVHIAHDCVVGNNVILANNATLGGHVKIGNDAIIGGLSAIHQFVRIGHNAIIGGMSGIESDVIPYGHAKGERASLSGLNIVGLKRKGFSKDIIKTLLQVYSMIFDSENELSNNIDNVKNKFSDIEEVMNIINFMLLQEKKSICKPKNYVSERKRAA